jgi:alkylation response protein AidB-like acyl-CoA dehydrogenase
MALWFEESREERAVLGPLREFLKAEVAPGAAERDRTGAFPWDLVRKMAQFGVFGATVPEAYGGAGLPMRLFARMVEEVAYYDGALALTVASHNSLATGHILLTGNEKQKAEFLPKLASGEALGAWGLTEPGAGLGRRRPQDQGRHQAVHHPGERGRGLRDRGPHRPGPRPREEAPGHLRLRLLPARRRA